jgi:hypothetical protein
VTYLHVDPMKASDVVVAAYRFKEGPIDISLGNASTRIDPGPPEPHILVIGDLADAERASDLFSVPLTRILRLKKRPEDRGAGAYDGFWGIAASVDDAAFLDAFETRGGVVVYDIGKQDSKPNDHVEPRAANVPALLAERVPTPGIRPRGFFGLSSGRVRIALAASILGIVASLILPRRRRQGLGLGAGVCVAALAMLVVLSNSRWPRVEIEFGMGHNSCVETWAILESIPPYPSDGRMMGSTGLFYPTGSEPSKAPALAFANGDELHRLGCLVVDRALPPDPADPITDPESLSSSTARALALTARQIVGPRGSVELDRTRGRLVLRFPRPSPPR